MITQASCGGCTFSQAVGKFAQLTSTNVGSFGRVGDPDVLAYAKTRQCRAHLIEALLLAIVNRRVNVPAMEYLDRDHRLVPSAPSTWSDVPGAIEGFDLEATGALLFRQNPLGHFP